MLVTGEAAVLALRDRADRRAFLLSFGLTLGARGANKKTAHWMTAAVLLALALLLNVLAAIAISWPSVAGFGW